MSGRQSSTAFGRIEDCIASRRRGVSGAGSQVGRVTLLATTLIHTKVRSRGCVHVERLSDRLFEP